MCVVCGIIIFTHCIHFLYVSLLNEEIDELKSKLLTKTIELDEAFMINSEVFYAAYYYDHDSVNKSF